MDFVSCILFLVLICTLSWLRSSRSRAASKLPPGPVPLPIIGNLLELGNKPHKSLAKLANIHGPIMCLKLGQVTSIVASSAEMAKQVLSVHDQSLSNRTVPDSMLALNHSEYSLPFIPVSDRWRTLRRICNNQLFADKILEAGQELRRQKLQQLLSETQQSSLMGEAVDIGRAAFQTTINMLSNAIFSVDLVHSGTAEEFRELESNIMKEVGRPNVSDYFPVFKMVDPQGVRRRTAIYFRKMMNIFHHLINQRLNLIPREDKDSVGRNDILDALLNISKENSQDMDKARIERLALDLFAAGTDTTTSTMEWAMAELLHNPEAMSKAKQELSEIIGKGRPVSESDIPRLPYLQAVIKETFRLHPPVPFLLPRKAATEVEICGYTVPKDSQVLVNVFAIGRDPKTWENPNSFLPERFLGSQIDVKGRHFELTPFGAGRRICPGLPLAMRMMFLVVGLLINCFDWQLPDGIKAENLDMEDKFGISVEKAQPLRAIPFPVGQRLTLQTHPQNK